MHAAKLPDAKAVNASVSRILTITGVATAAAVLLFLYPVIRFSPDQARLAGVVGGIAGIVFTIVGNLLQQPRIRVIQHYLANRESGNLTDQDYRDAFFHAMNFPRFIVLSTFFGQWVAMGILLPLALYISSQTFSLELALLTCGAAISGGFISQLFVYTLLKRSFAPVVAALSLDLPDPELRESLIQPVSLHSKIFILVTGMMITSALFSASLAQGRARRTVEALATSQQARAIEGVLLPLLEEQRIDEALPIAQAAVEPFGITFSLIDDEARAWIDESQSPLLDEELEGIRNTGLESGTSLAFESIATFAWRRLAESNHIVVASSTLSMIASERDKTRWYIMIASAAFVLIAIGLSLSVCREMVQATAALAHTLKRVASGDLTRRDVFESDDELGSLGRSVDAMSQSLNAMVMAVIGASDRLEQATAEIRSAATEVTSASSEQAVGILAVTDSVEHVGLQAREISSSAQDLKLAVDKSALSVGSLGGSGEQLSNSGQILHEKLAEVSHAIGELTNRSQEIASNTVSLAAASTETSGGIQDLSSALEAVELRASDAAGLSTDVVASAEQGRAQIQKSAESMERISQATLSLEKAIESLGGRTSQISSILGVIDSLADETNLLALNAAIISAQSGENGHAFSVVARGVKELANRVQQNTHEISQVLAGLQSESQNAGEAIARGTASVREGVELTKESATAMEAINAAAQASGQRSEQIVEAVREQSRAAAKMAALMEQVDGDIEGIRTRTSAQADDAHSAVESSREISSLADQLQNLTTALTECTEQISQSMSWVHGTSSEIDGSLQNQMQACELAQSALEGVQLQVNSNEGSASKVDVAMAYLAGSAEELRGEVAHFKLSS